MDPPEAETASHHEDSDNDQMPKVRGTKSRLSALERTSRQMTDALAHQGERCEAIDGRLRHVEEFVNETLGEFRGSAELLSDTTTLLTDMEEWLNGYKDKLKNVVAILTDLQDTVALLKQAVAQGGSGSTTPVKIKIKEPDAYDGT